jgi:hypothetical protein
MLVPADNVDSYKISVIMNLYDFLDLHNKSVIHEWAAGLESADRARLNSKLKQLCQMDFDLAWGTKLLAGPIYKHVYKLKIHGTIMLRPLLCRGPFDNDNEYTLLEGAIETNNKLTSGAPERAEKNRDLLVANPQRRKPHAFIR